jgi:hypothetical protein
MLPNRDLSGGVDAQHDQRNLGRPAQAAYWSRRARIRKRAAKSEAKKQDELLRRIEAKQLDAEDYDLIARMLSSYVQGIDSLKKGNTTIPHLRELLASASTESRRP